MNKTLPALVLVAAAAGGAYWWTHRLPAEGAATAAPSAAGSAPAGPNRAAGPQTVTVTTVQQRDVPVSFETAGTVVPLESVDVRPQVTATVRSVAIKEGQFVRRGEPLFTFDDRADRANLDRSRAQLARDRATLADLQRQLERAKELRAQNFVAQSNVDTVQAQVEAQLAAVKADEAAVQASEVSVSYAAITAPLGGRVGIINVNPGSLVTPGGAALVTISQIDPIGVSFNLPEGQLGALLRPGEAAAGAAAGGPGKGASGAGGKPGAEGAARAGGAGARPGGKGPGGKGGADAASSLVVLAPSAERGRNTQPVELAKGRVSFIDNQIDPATGTIRIKGTVANGRQALWPGQYVTVRMTLRTIRDALVIPVAAIIQRGNERSVYVVTAEGKAEQRNVIQRYVFADNAVVEGLEAGERVVVEGKQNLRSGTPVREAAADGPRAASRAGAAGAGASTASGAAAGVAASQGGARP